MAENSNRTLKWAWGWAYPYALTCVGAVWLWRYMDGRSEEQIMSVCKETASLALQFSSVSVGFIAAVIAIFFSIKESRLMVRLDTNNVHALSQLRSFMFQTFLFNWLTLVVSLPLRLALPYLSGCCGRYWLTTLSVLCMLSSLLMFRLVRILICLFARRRSIVDGN